MCIKKIYHKFESFLLPTFNQKKSKYNIILNPDLYSTVYMINLQCYSSTIT